MLAIPITGLCSVIQLCLFATPWTIAHQAPRSMEFSRQEYWSGLPFSTPGDLPDPGIEPTSPTLQVGSLPVSHLGNFIILSIEGRRSLVGCGLWGRTESDTTEAT